MNALRHGIYAQTVVMPGEDAEQFEQLREGLIETLQPVGTLEVVLVDKITVGLWRSRRLTAWETATEFAGACKRAREGTALPEPFDCRLDGRFQEQLARLHAAVDNATYKSMFALERARQWRRDGPLQ